MTLNELSQLYYLNREIEADRLRLSELQGSHSQRKEIEDIIKAKVDRCMQERTILERYIADIPDSLTRQVFTLRFINGLSWLQIAFSVGGGNTEDSVKKICYRYLKKNR